MRDINGLVQKATSQHGLLSTNQLRALGVSKSEQATLGKRGVLKAVRRGLVRLSGAPDTWEQRVMAACLTPGPAAVASHRSALRIWGLRTRWDGVEVSVRYPANRTVPGGIVHRSVDLTEADVVEVNCIPVTNPTRTLCDIGRTYGGDVLQRLVDHAVAIDLVTVRGLIDIRRRVGEHGRNGVVRLDLAIDGIPAGSNAAESGPEIHLLRVLLDGGLPAPVPQHNVRAGGRYYRLDLAYPEAKMAIEYDGVDVHTRVEGFVGDRRRQNDLVEAGWTILRFTHADLRDQPWVICRQVSRHLRIL